MVKDPYEFVKAIKIGDLHITTAVVSVYTPIIICMTSTSLNNAAAACCHLFSHNNLITVNI